MSNLIKEKDGHWFNNKGVDTYITGTHFMYLQWSKIDVGKPDLGNQTDYSTYSGKLVKQTEDVMVCAISRTDVQAFHSWRLGRPLIWQQYRPTHVLGFCPNLVPMQRKCSQIRLYPFLLTSRSSLNPYKTVWTDQRRNLRIEYPLQNSQGGDSIRTRPRRSSRDLTQRLTGKTPVITRTMGRNSNFSVHDESGKWERPNNILNNWRVTKTTLRLGARVIGKCMMGSTSNALDKGGENFKKLYATSDVTKRNANGQTRSGLYSLFIPMEWNYEGFIDAYGMPVFNTPPEGCEDSHGDPIEVGVIEHWNNEAEGLKGDQDALNEYYRQFPRTEEHAFRDETKNSIFNLAKIYEQIDYNEDLANSNVVTRGSFQWQNGIKDSKVIFSPNPQGRFLITWTPAHDIQNRQIIKNGARYPGNEHMGALGCDSYDISGTTDGRGSKGALHGLTKFSMEDAPPSTFFLEYVARPQTAEMFFEDVLMACVFYGMPLLCENNKPRLLYYFKRRGYRGYSMNRPDKLWNKLSVTEKEIGGIPNSSEDIKQAHASAIEMYIDSYVGLKSDGNYGTMYFTETLNDWAKFDINNRTKFDAAISSGLAIMACNKDLYRPSAPIQKRTMKVKFAKYRQDGNLSEIIK